MTNFDIAARRLLELARRGHEPSSEDVLRVRTALDARVLADPSLFAPSGAQALMGAGKALGVKVLLALSVGFGLGAVGSLAAISWSDRHAGGSSRAVASSAAVASVAVPPTLGSTVPAVEGAVSERSGPGEPSGSSFARAAAGSSARAAAAPEAQADMWLEIAALRRAQQLLHSGNASAALAELDVLAPSGNLLEERAATRALARCALGQRTSPEVSGFFERYPGSVHAIRVAAACGEEKRNMAPGTQTEITRAPH